MPRKQNKVTYPPAIESRRLGTLKLESDLHLYEASERLTIPTRRVRLCPLGLRLVIWLPEVNVLDMTHFVTALERQFDQWVNDLDRILHEAIPTIESAVARFWQIPDERAPTAQELLDSGEITHLNLSMGEESHEMHIHDAGDLIGSHDLILVLSDDFHPESAYFDG
ncbi:MAG: hypothetical protein KF757_10010 [Phycisphaeraceae bacterium]|nr:hypothetical protein [Phycisphaeraceae bacterium]MCW5763547.1 hypothetical protein [Phycisphaeraceae bacterium]